MDNIVKKAGHADLVTVHISVVRPVVEYACPVWHTNLPICFSDNIDMIQKRAVKSIFPGMSYVDIFIHTSRVSVEGKSSVCAISMKYRKIILIIIIISLDKILLSYIANTSRTHARNHARTRKHTHTHTNTHTHSLMHTQTHHHRHSGFRCSMGRCAQQ